MILIAIPALFVALLIWGRALRDACDDIADHRDSAEYDRIHAGFHTWHEPTPPPETLRAIAWPPRQTPTDLAQAYEPIPWTDPDWAVAELRAIVYANRKYGELIAACPN